MTEFEKFKNIYTYLIMETTFQSFAHNKIPSVGKNNILYRPKTINEFIKSFKNIKWIYENDNINLLYTEEVINEAPGSIDYPGTLCDEILNVKNGKVFNYTEISSYINNTWKYYDILIDNFIPIKVLKFDFSKLNDSINSYDNILIDFKDKKILNKLKEFEKNKNAVGGFQYFDDICLFIFNTNRLLKKKTILHEFTHYIQRILDVEKIKTNKIKDREKLKFLKLDNTSLNDLILMLSNEDEIIPFVNEFCEDVYNVFKEYKKLNKDLEWTNDFIEYFVSTILNSEDLYNEKLVNIYLKVNEDLTPMFIIIGCYEYGIDWEKIKHIMYVENKIDKYE